MERFSIKVGVVYMHIRVSRHLKEELVLATDKWLRVISNIMLFRIVIPLRNIVCIAVWSLVTCVMLILSNKVPWILLRYVCV